MGSEYSSAAASPDRYCVNFDTTFPVSVPGKVAEKVGVVFPRLRSGVRSVQSPPEERSLSSPADDAAKGKMAQSVREAELMRRNPAPSGSEWYSAKRPTKRRFLGERHFRSRLFPCFCLLIVDGVPPLLMVLASDTSPSSTATATDDDDRAYAARLIMVVIHYELGHQSVIGHQPEAKFLEALHK